METQLSTVRLQDEDSVQTEFQTSLETTLHDIEPRKKSQKFFEGKEGYTFLKGLQVVADQADFEVEKIIGQGGMGAVAKAKDRSLNRDVALKFVTNRNNVDLVRALKKEAEQAGKLAHENVVQVYSFHTVGEITFFAMEFVDGENLKQKVNSPLPPSDKQVLRIILEAAKGLRAAHDLGIIHRDIKPENIIISSEGRVKIADFGIAATRDELISQSGVISGTIGYMAPEQARGEPATHQSDIYALGATLYFALTGKPLIEKTGSSAELLKKNQNAEFDLKTDTLTKEIALFIQRCLSADISRRPLGVENFIKDLEKIIFSSQQTRSQRFKLSIPVKLRGAIYTATMIFLGAILGGVGVFLYNQQTTVSKAAVLRELQTLSDQRVSWIESSLDQQPNDAKLAILLGDIEQSYRQQSPLNVVKAIKQVDDFRSR